MLKLLVNAGLTVRARKLVRHLLADTPPPEFKVVRTARRKKGTGKCFHLHNGQKVTLTVLAEGCYYITVEGGNVEYGFELCYRFDEVAELIGVE